MRCLDSIKDAVDEIIIVDTGSTDATKEIARRYTDKVYDFAWVDDFSAARNKAFSKATMDYQMWMDADDVFPEESLDKLRELKRTLPPETDIVTMNYITHFAENGLPLLSVTRERLLRREKMYTWQDPVHECIPMIGRVHNADIEVHHKKIKQEQTSRRNINIYEKLKESGKAFTPRQLYYYARELKDHGEWKDAAHFFEQFLVTGKGWVEDNIATCFNLAVCYKQLDAQAQILPILLKSFEFAPPRAEICCEIGYLYKRANDYHTALAWFDIATKLGQPKSLGFVFQDCWGFIPNIEASVCSWQVGQHSQAQEFNERAAIFNPNSPAVAHNRAFFASQA